MPSNMPSNISSSALETRILASQLERYLNSQGLVLKNREDVYCFCSGSKEVGEEQISLKEIGSGRLIVKTKPKFTQSIKTFLEEIGLAYLELQWEPESLLLALLKLKARPENGVVQVVEGEYAITTASDPNPILSCDAVAATLLFPKSASRTALLVHWNLDGDDNEALRIYEEINSFLDGGEIGYVNFTRGFSFDTRTGRVLPFIKSNDPSLEERIKSAKVRADYGKRILYPCYISYLIQSCKRN